MTTDDKVKDEKLQYGISRGATKLSKNYTNMLQTEKSCHLVKVK